MPQDIRISELPETATLSGGEAVPLVQSGQTRRATVSTLRAGLAAAAHTHPASAISDASAAGRTLLTAADAAAQRAALGLGSLATQAASSVAVTGGAINGTAIGATTPASGSFTSLTASSLLTVSPGGNAAVALGDISLSFRTALSAKVIGMYADNAEKFRVGAAYNHSVVPLCPSVDAGSSLGLSVLRWNDVYATNATIQTSDARNKTDVAECPLGLDFILALRPVRYRFKDIDQPAETVRRSVERVVTAPLTREREEVRRVDGQYRLETVTETVEEPVLRLEPLFDTNGRPLLDGEGNPRLHPVPVTETVEVEEEVRPAHAARHHRPHDGLIAQEVKAVLDRLGLDMAAYIYDRDADLHGLRYGEFIAPLIRAVQELATRVTLLERAAA